MIKNYYNFVHLARNAVWRHSFWPQLLETLLSAIAIEVKYDLDRRVPLKAIAPKFHPCRQN
ncbi:hypothetical protein NG796_00470 [Laspinema sp. A4]|uniref:hypothetical protein n=1 Tax=Laspinema sp. D2d TaxID=2953686 RepID=UPI0021BB9FA8|nr:hypothetical protein [Laspinema sp. D2d]MCT7981758.1 hypothetical protein [Laspinema sp. D2d]